MPGNDRKKLSGGVGTFQREEVGEIAQRRFREEEGEGDASKGRETYLG